jgi:hypothetical protein
MRHQKTTAIISIVSVIEKMSYRLRCLSANAHSLFFSPSIAPDRDTKRLKRSSTMKRILSALIASVALFAAVSGAAHAAAPEKCNGPASYCNVFFGN